MKVLGIVRKSPSGSEQSQAVSVQLQKSKILNRIRLDYLMVGLPEVVWAVDICKGDDAGGRTSFLKEVGHIRDFDAAYCLNVDRFSRSWLGIKWLHEYFLEVPLRFVEGVGDLYNKDGDLIEESYLFFFIQCGFAQYELLKIRKRTRAGIDKLRENPMKWAQKYRGRPKGSKNKGKGKLKNRL